MYIILEQPDGSLNVTDTGDSYTKTEIIPATANQDPYIRVTNFGGNAVLNEKITGSVEIVGVHGNILVSKTFRELAKAIIEKPPAHCFHPKKALLEWMSINGNINEEKIQALLHNFVQGVDVRLDEVRLIVLDPKFEENHLVCFIAKQEGDSNLLPLVALNDQGEIHMIGYAADEVLKAMGMTRHSKVSVGWQHSGDLKSYELVTDRYQQIWIKG
jgi:hypothetical protein